MATRRSWSRTSCRLAATDYRAQIGLITRSFRFAVARISQFAAVARDNTGTPHPLAGRLETIKISRCAHALTERRYHEGKNEKGFRMTPSSNSREFSGGTKLYCGGGSALVRPAATTPLDELLPFALC